MNYLFPCSFSQWRHLVILRKFAKIFAIHGAPNEWCKLYRGDLATYFIDTRGKCTAVVDTGSHNVRYIFSKIYIDSDYTSSKCATGVNNPDGKFAASAGGQQ